MSADRNAKQAKTISLIISALMLIYMVATPFINHAMTKSIILKQQLDAFATTEYVDTKHEEAISYTDKSFYKLEKSTDDKIDIMIEYQKMIMSTLGIKIEDKD